MAVINYENLPSTRTPLNATNLNTMQEIYTKGTFTPGIEGSSVAGTVSYTVREGNYTRIGNILVYNFRIGSNSFTGSNGYLVITGLPNYSYVESGVNSVIFSKAYTFFNSQNCITRLYGAGLLIDGGNLAPLTNASWSDDTYIYGTGVLLINE